MYWFLWRVLPGPVWLKVIELLIIVAIILTVLFIWVFPWVNGVVNNRDIATLPSGPSDLPT